MIVVVVVVIGVVAVASTAVAVSVVVVAIIIIGLIIRMVTARRAITVVVVVVVIVVLGRERIALGDRGPEALRGHAADLALLLVRGDQEDAVCPLRDRQRVLRFLVLRLVQRAATTVAARTADQVSQRPPRDVSQRGAASVQEVANDLLVVLFEVVHRNREADVLLLAPFPHGQMQLGMEAVCPTSFNVFWRCLRLRRCLRLWGVHSARLVADATRTLSALCPLLGRGLHLLGDGLGPLRRDRVAPPRQRSRPSGVPALRHPCHAEQVAEAQVYGGHPVVLRRLSHVPQGLVFLDHDFVELGQGLAEETLVEVETRVNRVDGRQ